MRHSIASTITSVPGLIDETNWARFSEISTAGIFDIAHAEAVSVSVLLVQMIAEGACPLVFSEYRTYAPTLLPTAFGKTRTLDLR